MTTNTGPLNWRSALVAVPLLLALAGCAATSVTSDGSAQSAPMPAAGGKAEIATDATGSAVTGPQIARTAGLTVIVEDPGQAAIALRQTAASFGGTVLSEYVTTTGAAEKGGTYYPMAYTTITISVPSAQLEPALDAIGKLGKVTVRTVTANDVTAAVVDVEARVRTLQDSITRVRALMDRAGTLTEITTIEGELTKRQAELESLLAQQKALATQVEQAPITVTLIPVTEAPVETGTGFLAGLRAGWASFLKTGIVLVTALGAALPFVIAVLLVAGVPLATWWGIRRRRRTAARANHATSSEAKPAESAGAGPDTQTETPEAEDTRE